VYYYSVDLALGQRFCMSSPAYDGVILVDDITYSVDLDPCEPEDRCALIDFDANEVPNDGGYHNPGGSVPPGLRPLGQLSSTGFIVAPIGTGNYFLSPTLSWFVVVRATVFVATMENEAQGNRIFDRVSHTMYGEVIGTRYLPRTYWNDGINVGFTDPHDHTSNLTSSLPLNGRITMNPEVSGNMFDIAAVQTSESRHYQSPEIVNFLANAPAGNGVKYSGAIGPGHSTYINATACVKGRVIFNDGTLPLPQTVSVAVH
jgi:hypothetical protein